MTDYIRLIASFSFIALSTTAFSGTNLIPSSNYDAAKANNYWIVWGSSIPKSGDTLHWIRCVDISESKGTAGDVTKEHLVIVDSGLGHWIQVPANDNSAKACVNLPRTIAVNPIKSISDQLSINPNVNNTGSGQQQQNAPTTNNPGAGTNQPQNLPPQNYNSNGPAPSNSDDPYGDINKTGQ